MVLSPLLIANWVMSLVTRICQKWKTHDCCGTMTSARVPPTWTITKNVWNVQYCQLMQPFFYPIKHAIMHLAKALWFLSRGTFSFIPMTTSMQHLTAWSISNQSKSKFNGHKDKAGRSDRCFLLTIQSSIWISFSRWEPIPYWCTGDEGSQRNGIKRPGVRQASFWCVGPTVETG